MSPNLNPPIPAARGITGEGWAAIIGAIGSAFLLLRMLATPKPAKSDAISRSEFYAEMIATRERINATHLAILDKLDANHRELLAVLNRQAARVSAVETALARVDERTESLNY